MDKLVTKQTEDQSDHCDDDRPSSGGKIVFCNGREGLRSSDGVDDTPSARLVSYGALKGL